MHVHSTVSQISVANDSNYSRHHNDFTYVDFITYNNHYSFHFLHKINYYTNYDVHDKRYDVCEIDFVPVVAKYEVHEWDKIVPAETYYKF